jgi:phage gpG-like protein
MVKLELRGLNALRATLQKFDNQLMTRATRIIGSTGVDLTKDSFKEQRDPYGNNWQPLAAYTVKKKGSSGILADTGRLRNSISFEVRDLDVAIGTNVEYAKYHFELEPPRHGTRRLPVREFLPTRELPTSWETEILESLEGLVRDLGA